MARLFFGLPVPPDLRPPILELAADLRRSGVTASWVPGENLHVTVKFLGEIAAARIPELVELARGEAAAVPAFDVTLAGAGTFPGPRHPRVLWIGGRASSDGPSELASRIDALARRFGVAPEERPFRLHCTLGRVRPDARVPPALADALKLHAATPLGSYRCDALVLFESRLGGGPARYSAVATLPLAGSTG
jgi:2'-5' RNA ligase